MTRELSDLIIPTLKTAITLGIAAYAYDQILSITNFIINKYSTQITSQKNLEKELSKELTKYKTLRHNVVAKYDKKSPQNANFSNGTYEINAHTRAGLKHEMWHIYNKHVDAEYMFKKHRMPKIFIKTLYYTYYEPLAILASIKVLRPMQKQKE